MNPAYNALRNLKPEKAFLTVAAIYSLVFILLTPPFQSPDEAKHFYRAYQVSTGQLFVKNTDNRLGSYVPSSFVAVADSFYYLQWQPSNKTDFKMIKKTWSVPLNRKEYIFKDNPGCSLYFPLVYLHQAGIICIAVMLNSNPLTIFYFVRIFNALIWIFAFYYIIKKVPVYKNLILATALLPMSVFINTGINADVITNILLFLFISFVLRYKFINNKLTISKLLLLSILGLAVSVTKSAYIFFTLLIFLIPASKYKGKMQRYIFYGTSFGSIIIIYTLWSAYMDHLYLPYSAYNPNFRHGIELFPQVNMHQQLQYVLSHPLHFIKVLFRSIAVSFSDITEQYIGRLGWLDTRLPYFVILSGIILLLSVAFTDNKNTKRLSLKNRLFLTGISIVTLLMIYFSQYLVWSPVGGDEIMGVQGRYFIPVIPLFLMSAGGILNTGISDRKLTLAVMFISIILLTVSANAMHKRYYFKPELYPTEVTCNAEKVSEKDKTMLISNGMLFGNASGFTNEEARSGSHSLKLNKNNLYGFTYRINDLRREEKIEVTVWRKGNDGGLVLAGKNINELYTGENFPDSIDLRGWQRLRKSVTVTEKLKDREIIIYVYYTGSDSVYFDDFKITYYRRKK